MMIAASQFIPEAWLKQSVGYLLPEYVMAIGLLLVLVLTFISYKKNATENAAVMGVSLVTVVGALVLIWPSLPTTIDAAFMQSLDQTAYFGSIKMDYLAIFGRALILMGTAITILISHFYLSRFTKVVGDFYALMMSAALGGMILVGANDLITVFVGLETLSIPSYILAGYLRKNRLTAEASFKYLIYGSAASGILLFGLSLLYGLVGSVNLVDISSQLVQLGGIKHPMIVLITVMVTVSIAFKLSLAPFHMWTPDVYDGAPTPVSAFLSVVSKAAALVFAIRVFFIVFATMAFMNYLFVALSVISMTVGNLVALRQTQAKRLLAYSTIAQAGYMLLGLVIINDSPVPNLASLLFYVASYVFMNLGAFACVIKFNALTGRDDIASYAGLAQKKPLLVFAFSIFLLSLAGIPITSGFFAKFFLFQAVAFQRPEMLYLVFFALLNSTVSLYYYVKLINVMVVDEPSDVVKAIGASGQDTRSVSLSFATALCCAVTLLLGIYAMPSSETEAEAGKVKAQKFQPSVYASCISVAKQLVYQRMQLVSTFPANFEMPKDLKPTNPAPAVGQ